MADAPRQADEVPEFAVGQVWTRGRGIWQTGKRIVDIDRRRSVTFLQVESLWGGDASWISVGLFAAWIEDAGATLTVRPACVHAR